MNRYLCEPNRLMLNNATAYHFAQNLGDISVYILPILALVGNSLTLLVILKNPQLNCSSYSVYVKSLAISDTLVLIFKLFSYLNKTSKYFYFSSMCTILVFCGESSVLLSVWIIVLITIERTLVVLFPLHKTKFVSINRARVKIIIVAILIIVFSSRILIIPMDTSIEQKNRCHPIASWQSYRRLNATITEFGYCYIPLTIVIIGNFLIICTVKRAVIRRHGMLTNNSYQQKRPIDLHENQLMLMLLIVTLMFIVYFVPFTIINVISRLGLPFNHCFTQKSFEIYLVIRSFTELLKDLNFCTNFIIYCVSGRRFRYALFSLFKDHHRQSSIISRNCKTTSNRTELLSIQNSHQRPCRLSLKPTIEETQC
ncbi:unnamed protein product [Rotaria sordida]|uniref:G-protein coupled receptors family 1 profile domain-containing protein n=1 Tax=Rotaria sordida TaxID=392033 RepID=A0A813VU55_9BILA|nr:unnamed protein product [Rotaria sordida]CAF3684024.1 unnamed protein product [Rotaria sordida]